MSSAAVVGSDQSPASAATGRVAVLIGALATVGAFYAGLFAPSFQVDSWSYLELSSTVFGDFFRYNTVRQYSEPGPYSNSFPPLWPVLLGATRASGADLGIYTGYLLNAVIHLGLLGVLMRLAGRLGMPPWGGALVYLLLLSFKPYMSEDALAAGAMPLSLLLFFGGLSLLLRPVGFGGAALAGLLTGGACATRFDFALAAAVLTLAVGRISGAGRAGVFAAAVALVLVPWVGYNLKHFGKPFASDNSRQVLATHPSSVLDYYSGPVPTLTSHPGQWASGLVSKKLTRLVRGGWIALVASPLPALAVVWLAVGRGVEGPAPPPEYRRFVALGAALTPVLVAPVLLVGYGMIPRYYTVPLVLALLAAVPALWRRLPQPVWGPWRVGALLALLATASVVQLLPDVVAKRVPLWNPRPGLVPPAATDEARSLFEAVRADAAGGPYRVVITDDLTAARLGALTGEPVALKPVLRGSAADWVQDWNITHVYDTSDWLATVPNEGVVVEPLPFPNLYRISPAPRS